MNRIQWTVAVLAPVIAVVGLVVLDAGPNVAIVAALMLLGCAVSWLAGDVTAELAPPPPAVGEPDPPGTPPDLRLTTLRQALAAGSADARLADRLHRQLVAVIDDELRVTHGIDRVTDPSAASSVLGPELSHYVDDREAAASLPTRRLERIVTQIEQL